MLIVIEIGPDEEIPPALKVAEEIAVTYQCDVHVPNAAGRYYEIEYLPSSTKMSVRPEQRREK